MYHHAMHNKQSLNKKIKINSRGLHNRLDRGITDLYGVHYIV